MKLYDYEKKHLRQLRKEAAGCALFLKRNEDFPLEGPCEIGLYGNGGRHTQKGGTGSGDVNSRFYVTAEKGLEWAGFTITTKDWLDRYDQVKKDRHERFIREIRSGARKSGMMAVQYSMGKVECEGDYDIPTGHGETAVYVLSRVCGEGSDRQWKRGDILLTKTEISDIIQLAADYKKFILVLNVGGPVDLSPIADAVDNILLLSQLGAVTGVVLADILLGKADPSGKLAASWVSEQKCEAIGEFGNRDNTRYNEGVYVGYRYYETQKVQTLFPFGFGKSYTDFDLIPGNAVLSGSSLTVNVRVKNTGSYAGREVVEVYASLPDDRIDQPARVLAGFQKTHTIEPGQEEEVSVKVNLKDITTFDAEAACYLIPAGNTIISIGQDSCHVNPVCILHTNEDVPVKKVRNALGKTDFVDFFPKITKSELKGAEEQVDSDGNSADAVEEQTGALQVPIIEFSDADIPCQVVDYDLTEDIDPRASSMTDEELAKASVGAFKEGGVLSVIGQAGQKVPGSAGETFEDKERDIRALVMADGPAGLRIDRDYGIDKDGAYSYGNPLLFSMLEFAPNPVRLLPLIQRKQAEKRTRNGGELKHQYATAIPIGTAIAQSWDTDFAKACGDLVGTEMEIYDVDIWLAPALNIQRDIRCGRNFEYYSEDPLISGCMAAAVTKGVQKHEGRYTTIKHFAANDQETNRMANNSCVSERALREIYLRGFEIAVRESQPGFVMNSYNLINGTHTSERRDLMTDILRAEFGFKGCVMTDWVVPGMTEKNSHWGYPDPVNVIAAGTSLFMPGSQGDYEAILSGLKNGRLTRQQAEMNVSRLLKYCK
jgi:beta-glucosidase